MKIEKCVINANPNLFFQVWRNVFQKDSVLTVSYHRIEEYVNQQVPEYGGFSQVQRKHGEHYRDFLRETKLVINRVGKTNTRN